MVLLIIGFITAATLSAVVAFTKGAREKITRQNQDGIKVALQNFAARNGRLPCPAVPTVASTAATFGVEAPTPGTCTGAVGLGGGAPTPGVFGTVPWKSLGISTDNAIDGWNNQFSYAVTRTATNTSFSPVAGQQSVGGMRGVLTLHSDAPIANGLPPTGNQLNACSTIAGDNSCNLFAAAIVISYGVNGLGARTWFGVSTPAPTSARELENTDTNVAFVQSDNSNGVATFFDDIVMTLTPADVLASLVAQGGVKSDNAALQEKFRLLVAAIATDAVANRTGGVGTWSYLMPATTGASVAYPFIVAKFNAQCLLGNPPNTVAFLPASMQTILDPWGNQFRYQRADTGVESGETCLSPAMIVSAGPDGIINTADDTVYYVSLAELQAVFLLVGW